MSDDWGNKFFDDLKSREDAQRPVERLVIPPEVLDLVRFMCATWTDIDKWAYENMDGNALTKYPA